MAERTISIAPLPADCTSQHIKKVLKEFAVVRVAIQVAQRKAFVQLQDASDVEAMGLKYDDCRIPELGNAEMELVTADFQWEKELQPRVESPHKQPKNLLAIRDCELHDQNEGTVREILKHFAIKKIVLQKETGVVLLEFARIDQLQGLELRFEGGKVSALGPRAYIDSENAVDAKYFLEKYQLQVGGNQPKEEEEEEDRFKEQIEKTTQINLEEDLEDAQERAAKRRDQLHRNSLKFQQELQKQEQEKNKKIQQERKRIEEEQRREQELRQRLLEEQRKRQQEDQKRRAELQLKRKEEEQRKRVEQQKRILEQEQRKARAKREEEEKRIAEQRRQFEERERDRRIKEEKQRLERQQEQNRVREIEEETRKKESEYFRKVQEQNKSKIEAERLLREQNQLRRAEQERRQQEVIKAQRIKAEQIAKSKAENEERIKRERQEREREEILKREQQIKRLELDQRKRIEQQAARVRKQAEEQRQRQKEEQRRVRQAQQRRLQEEKNRIKQKEQGEKSRYDEQLERLIEEDRKSTQELNQSTDNTFKKEINLPLIHGGPQKEEKRQFLSDAEAQKEFRVKPSALIELVPEGEPSKVDWRFGQFLSAVLVVWIYFIVMH